MKEDSGTTETAGGGAGRLPTGHLAAPGEPRISTPIAPVNQPPGTDSEPPLRHVFEVLLVGPNARAEDIVSQLEHDVEVPVQMPVMQAVISGQKLVDRPRAEGPPFRLVHLQMNLVPRPVVKHHHRHEGRGTLPGYEGNECGNRNSF